MTKCYHKKPNPRDTKSARKRLKERHRDHVRKPIRLTRSQGREVEAMFNGGDISGNGGLTLLHEADRRTGLVKSVARGLADPRRKASCRHSAEAMFRQRIYALAAGHEDLNDHGDLRNDPVLQAVTGRDDALASPSTLCRFEQRCDREAAVSAHETLFDQFVMAQGKKAPRRLVLDFDSTGTILHGEQEGRHWHGYHGHYSYLPLMVFCGRFPLVAWLRPSSRGDTRHVLAILALLVKALRRQWPKVEIVFRGDAGFYHPRLLSWCERNAVHYIVGFKGYPPLKGMAAGLVGEAGRKFRQTGRKQKLFGSFSYRAGTWKAPRRVIAKSEHGPEGTNLRFVVTSMEQTDRHLYGKVYCARGDMENRIKDQQLDLFGDRLSCHAWWPNQWRLLLSTLALALLEQLRRLALEGTELAKASPRRIRLVLLKIGATVVRNTRRIRFMMSESYPHQGLFATVAERLDTS